MPANSDPAERKWFQGLRLVWMFAGLTALFVLVALQNDYFLCHPHWELFLREVSFALLLAAIFGSTIEEIQRKEFIRLVTEEREKLKRDVFLYAYGHNLPDQIKDEIRDRVLKTNFYRRDLVIDWEVSPPDASTHLMKVVKRYSFTVVNNTSSPHEWDFVFTSIGADDKKVIADVSLVKLVVRRNGKSESHPGKDLRQGPVPGQPHMTKFATKIKMEPEEAVDIHYEVLQMKRLYGDDKFNSREPVVGVSRVKLRFPPDTRVDLSVSCKTRPLSKAPDHGPPSLFSFEFDEGLFPYQGISVCWSVSEVMKGAEQAGAGV